jgi:hypothetical protein
VTGNVVRRPRLEVSRAQILAFRRRVGALDARLPPGRRSLRQAAWAGLQDSMPRAALLSIHARVSGTQASAWQDPSLVQIWGPRYSVFVVAARDRALFTLGRLPDDGPGRQRAEDAAARLSTLLGDRQMKYGEAGRALGVNHNWLRYGTTTGTIAIHWDGAHQPTVRVVPRPEIDPADARVALARRYLHVFAPARPDSFARWAGIRPKASSAAFDALGDELVPVRTPIGHGWILAEDEPAIRDAPAATAATRLLPSGDAYFLLHGADRALLVPDAKRRDALWTSRVWPGAVLVDGEIAGTWRRTRGELTIEPWRRLSRVSQRAVEAEAAALPLPDVDGSVAVRWSR